MKNVNEYLKQETNEETLLEGFFDKIFGNSKENKLISELTSVINSANSEHEIMTNLKKYFDDNNLSSLSKEVDDKLLKVMFKKQEELLKQEEQNLAKKRKELDKNRANAQKIATQFIKDNNEIIQEIEKITNDIYSAKNTKVDKRRKGSAETVKELKIQVRDLTKLRKEKGLEFANLMRKTLDRDSMDAVGQAFPYSKAARKIMQN